MNSVSWMIYLADVVDGVESVAFSAAMMAGIAITIASMILVITMVMGGPDFWSYDGPEVRAEKTKSFNTVQSGAGKAIKISIWTIVASCIVIAAVPSKATMYAIAASEVGEQVITSPTGEKAVNALNAWLDKQAGSGGE